jgi:hypothetical protein
LPAEFKTNPPKRIFTLRPSNSRRKLLSPRENGALCAKHQPQRWDKFQRMGHISPIPPFRFPAPIKNRKSKI